ncbi:hypothetical protein NIE88_09690 [Sporolactobacillus shoreicorticis]|uniref:Uncharacterized protein n=1 Tax=Sporolactobacillus shoreicorticis TaxID=1923877 RepID=A0ABW5S916_9BACL|nr:hypothetical protein [Sporolactobacillus shoreicorticis]MCO7126047.1 hypothetical protein [Sporolactobacillus shoreicorticis]
MQGIDRAYLSQVILGERGESIGGLGNQCLGLVSLADDGGCDCWHTQRNQAENLTIRGDLKRATQEIWHFLALILAYFLGLLVTHGTAIFQTLMIIMVIL